MFCLTLLLDLSYCFMLLSTLFPLLPPPFYRRKFPLPELGGTYYFFDCLLTEAAVL